MVLEFLHELGGHINRHSRAARGVRLAALAVAAVLVGATAAGAANSGTAKKPPAQVNLQILSFNDYHGHLDPPGGTDATLGPVLDPTNTLVGGAEYLSTTLTNLRAGNTNSLTVTAGDLIGGTPFLSGLFHDEPSVETLEAMKLDVSGVGNHEFDEGITELRRMQNGGCHPVDGCYFPNAPYDGADFPWLAANVFDIAKQKTVLPATWIKKVDNVKVGFIGMTLEDTPVLVAQAGIAGLDFRDEVESADLAVQQLKAASVDTIVVLLHEGGVQTGTYNGCSGISGPIVAIAQNLDPEIDLVVTGHTHQPYVCNIPDPAGQPRMVTSASSFGRVVTETKLVIDQKSGEVLRDQVTSVNHLVTRTVPKDPALTTIIEKWRAIAAPIANREVGRITTDITRSISRATEASLGNLIADAQLAATTANGAQIALMNPGGVRADLVFAANPGNGETEDGIVTYGEAFTVQPFGNLLVTMDMTGQQLIDVLEQQAIAGRPGGRDVLILGVSAGLTFDYQGSAPFGSRVSNERLNGAPLDPAAVYRVTVNNFLADGGDAFSVFTQGTNRIGGGDDLVAFTNYLTANSPVAPAPIDRINEIP